MSPPTDQTAASLAASIARAFRCHVVDEALPRIGRCVELLDEAQIWQRHGEHGNSVGNLLLHLEGNVRQWILCGVGGAADERRRDAEFAATGASEPSARSYARLSATTVEAAAIVDRLTAEELLATRTFQQRYRRPVIAGVLHVLEHFSGHAYQIYAWTKELRGVDLRFFDL